MPDTEETINNILYEALVSVMPELIQSKYNNAFLKAKAKLLHLTEQCKEQGAIEFRNKLSTNGYPLNSSPKLIKMPVPCPRCGAEEYFDWTLYPHQVYNKYMPGGVGHYCLPCFCAIVTEADTQVITAASPSPDTDVAAGRNAPDAPEPLAQGGQETA